MHQTTTKWCMDNENMEPLEAQSVLFIFKQ